MRKSLLPAVACLALQLSSSAQPDRWQQRVKYTMDINMDVSTNRFTGKQSLAYTNNSPDTLRKVFYHLYWNAFQPGSMMDVRSLNLPDPDPRVKDPLPGEGPAGRRHRQGNRLRVGVVVRFGVEGLPVRIGPEVEPDGAVAGSAGRRPPALLRQPEHVAVEGRCRGQITNLDGDVVDGFGAIAHALTRAASFRICFHSAAVTGCTDRRLPRLSRTISASAAVARSSASGTGRANLLSN